MELVDYSTSALSILPAVLALTLAIVTRRVLLSLGLGVLLGGILLANFSPMATLHYLANQILALVWSDGALNTWNLSIVAFLLLLGMMTAILSLSGGTRAFANWALRRIKSKRAAQALAGFLGVFIFIDDYFNSLAVGSISRPVTDRAGVSRAKLAYILDSTAAPMCVITPISSWGAYIMTVVSGILLSHNIHDYTPIQAYMDIIPLNYYPIFALILVFVVAYFNLNIGPMKKHEMSQELSKADNSEELINELDIVESDEGKVSDLIYPILALIAATVFFMIFTGYQAMTLDGKPFAILGAFENTNVGASLVYGAIIGLAVSLISVIRQKMTVSRVSHALYMGGKSMVGAVVILFFAWAIGSVIGDMETGKYMSSLVDGSIPPQFLPVLLFILSGIMAFATGTSWGTFGIMLPIAGDMAAFGDLTLMLPMLSAVLAGSVFGDHCSPISDTTILSSTGARCNHIDHVRTQLPYALIAAATSIVGYIVLGFTDSTGWSAFAATGFFTLIITLLVLRNKQDPEAVSA